MCRYLLEVLNLRSLVKMIGVSKLSQGNGFLAGDGGCGGS